MLPHTTGYINQKDVYAGIAFVSYTIVMGILVWLFKGERSANRRRVPSTRWGSDKAKKSDSKPKQTIRDAAAAAPNYTMYAPKPMRAVSGKVDAFTFPYPPQHVDETDAEVDIEEGQAAKCDGQEN